MAKRKLWHSKLTKAQKKHLKEDAGCSLVSKAGFVRTIEWQKKNDVVCFECQDIARKIGVDV